MTKLNQRNSDKSDPEGSLLEWVQDMIYMGVQLCGTVILGAVALAGWSYGLRAAGWI